MSEKPLTFSIAMATYNGARHLRAQLDSIAAQTLLPIELQIGDDGSKDDTRAIIEDFARSAPFPVRLHRNVNNLGYGQNFIDTAQRCSGDWIAFSDQDDVWLPEKLATCRERIESAAGEILLVAHRARVVDEQLQPTGSLIPEEEEGGVSPPLSHHLTWSHYGFAMVFKRQLLGDIEPWPRIPTKYTDIDRYPHDVWISSLANMLGVTLHLDDALCLYRRHAGSVTETAKSNSGFNVSALFATGSSHYRHVASVCREAAACMEHHAGRVTHHGWSERMVRGRDAYLQLADALERRARIYSDAGLPQRLGSVASLCLGRGYFGLAGSSFGARALAKDLIASLAPRLFRQKAVEGGS